MQWADVRRHFPHQWVVIEAISAYTEGDRRMIDELSVVDTYPDGQAAWNGYSALHQQFSRREFYPVHTDREDLEIRDTRWSSIKASMVVTE